MNTEERYDLLRHTLQAMLNGLNRTPGQVTEASVEWQEGWNDNPRAHDMGINKMLVPKVTLKFTP